MKLYMLFEISYEQYWNDFWIAIVCREALKRQAEKLLRLIAFWFRGTLIFNPRSWIKSGSGTVVYSNCCRDIFSIWPVTFI